MHELVFVIVIVSLFYYISRMIIDIGKGIPSVVFDDEKEIATVYYDELVDRYNTKKMRHKFKKNHLKIWLPENEFLVAIDSFMLYITSVVFVKNPDLARGYPDKEWYLFFGFLIIIWIGSLYSWFRCYWGLINALIRNDNVLPLNYYSKDPFYSIRSSSLEENAQLPNATVVRACKNLMETLVDTYNSNAGVIYDSFAPYSYEKIKDKIDHFMQNNQFQKLIVPPDKYWDSLSYILSKDGSTQIVKVRLWFDNGPKALSLTVRVSEDGQYQVVDCGIKD